jgi:hypothetical protein
VSDPGTVGRMRPPGARERIREVARAELDILESWTDRRLRVELAAFVDVCARLVFDDHPVAWVLRCYALVDSWLGDPGQLRTGTDFEARCLQCVEELRPIVGGMAARPIEEVPFSEQDDVFVPLALVPPRVVLGDDGPDSQFNLVCWNQANAVAEGAQRPYRAARGISAVGFHEPVDVFGLIEPMTVLTERYEDVPEARAATAAEIVRELDAFRAVAPWPLSGA